MPLPIVLPVPIDGDVPVREAADVAKHWPPEVRRSEVAPVRDALAEGMAAAFVAYEGASSYAAAQSDPTRATGQYLEVHATEVRVFPQEGETTEELRERLFATPEVVTPNAILAAANQVVSRYTEAKAQLCESILDRWFVTDGDPNGEVHSYVTDGTASVEPDYPDRRYPYRPQRSPTGALPFSDHEGRLFILRVPQIGAVVGSQTYVDDGSGGSEKHGFFITDGALAGNAYQAFIYPGLAEAVSAYQQIANSVDRLTGHGVRWVLWVDPKLT